MKLLGLKREKKMETNNNYHQKIIQDSDKIIQELGCNNVFEALDKIKQ